MNEQRQPSRRTPRVGLEIPACMRRTWTYGRTMPHKADPNHPRRCVSCGADMPKVSR